MIKIGPDSSFSTEWYAKEVINHINDYWHVDSLF